MIFNEIKCHVNTSLDLVGGCIPCIPICVRACSHCLKQFCESVQLSCFFISRVVLAVN